MISLKDHNIGAVLLAAGASTRMGSRHKLRLPLADGRSVLAHALEQALSWEPARLVVVLQPGTSGLLPAIPGLPIDAVVNEDYASGMSSSLRLGISALPAQVDAALVLLADQPFVSTGIIEELISAFISGGKEIAIPVYGDIPGPPTLFRRSVFPELLALAGDEGARSVVRRDPARVSRVLLPTESLPPDLDTPEDYERFMAQVGR